MTYVLLNLAVMVIVVGAIVLLSDWQALRAKPIFYTLGITIVLTAIFDSLIIALGLVTYDSAKILGVYIGKAPIEDFAYTIVMVVLIPVLWKRFKA